MVHAVTLSSKGQVTIPKAVRDRLRLKPGDQVVFRERGDQVVVEPVVDVMELFGAVHVEGPQDWSAVREATMRRVAAQTAREGLEADDPQGG